nr:hypothetical protein HmN_001018200 [Hymenolepis microstoma]
MFLDMSTLKHPVAVIPITVEMVLKGPMMEHTTVNLHYLVDGFCGVDRTSFPESDETYVITAKSPVKDMNLAKSKFVNDSAFDWVQVKENTRMLLVNLWLLLIQMN